MRELSIFFTIEFDNLKEEEFFEIKNIIPRHHYLEGYFEGEGYVNYLFVKKLDEKFKLPRDITTYEFIELLSDCFFDEKLLNSILSKYEVEFNLFCYIIDKARYDECDFLKIPRIRIDDKTLEYLNKFKMNLFINPIYNKH